MDRQWLPCLDGLKKMDADSRDYRLAVLQQIMNNALLDALPQEKMIYQSAKLHDLAFRKSIKI